LKVCYTFAMIAEIIYFSFSGNTKALAGMIADWLRDKGVHPALFRIPHNPSNSFVQNCIETIRKKETVVTRLPDIAGADIVFFGCPVWTFTIPAPMRACIAQMDLAGKKVVLFLTYGSGTGKERAMKILQDAVESRGGTILGTFAIPGRKVARETERVHAILDSLMEDVPQRHTDSATERLTIQRICTEDAPKALGPYSQAVVAGPFVFVSGQIGIDPASDCIVEGIEAQTAQAIHNLSAVLAAAGASLVSVVKTTVFLSDMSCFSAMNGVYARFFSEKPARSTAAVSSLPRGVLVEIECIAVIR